MDYAFTYKMHYLDVLIGIKFETRMMNGVIYEFFVCSSELRARWPDSYRGYRA
jgi:hypothetical protein